jgi:hypothetical protein
MLSNIVSLTALALAASRLVSAQTFTLCNPTKTSKSFHQIQDRCLLDVA